MVYRHLEAEAEGGEEAQAAGRTRMAEDALLNSSVSNFIIPETPFVQ